MSFCPTALPRAGEIDLGERRSRRQRDSNDQRDETQLGIVPYIALLTFTTVAEQGVGSHLPPFGSFLNTGATSLALRRYVGIFDLRRDREPLLTVRPLVDIPVLGQHGVLAVGNAVLRRYPARRFLVTTRSDPPVGRIGGASAVRSAGLSCSGTFGRGISHCATETPCQVRGVLAGALVRHRIARVASACPRRYPPSACCRPAT